MGRGGILVFVISLISIVLFSGDTPLVFADIWTPEGNLPNGKSAYFFGFRGNGNARFDVASGEAFRAFILDNNGAGVVGAWNDLDRDTIFDEPGRHEWPGCNGTKCDWTRTIAQMRDVFFSEGNEELLARDTKLIIFGNSFGGAAATFVATDITSVDYDLVWLIDPVGPTAHILNLVKDCGLTHVICTIFAKDRVFESNTKAVVSAYQTEEPPPRENLNLFPPGAVFSNPNNIFIKYVEADCPLEALFGCHSYVGGQGIGRTEAINILQSMNNKPRLCFSNDQDCGNPFLNVKEGDIFEIPLLGIDQLTRWEHLDSVEFIFRIVSITPNIAELEISHGITKIKLLPPFIQPTIFRDGNAKLQALDNALVPSLIQMQLEDNGFPCDGCTNVRIDDDGNICVPGPLFQCNFNGRDLNPVAMGSLGKWDRKSVSVFISNVPPTPILIGDSETETIEIDLTFNAIDPSPVDQAAGFSYEIEWWDGTTEKIPDEGLTTDNVNFKHRLQAVGTFEVKISATDKDGGKGTTTVIVLLSDLDGDGIADKVDTLPEEFSDDFEDITNFGGETEGTIIDRGDQEISVIEESVPDDGVYIGAFSFGDDMVMVTADDLVEGQQVKVAVEEPSPDTPAQISVCGNSALLRLTFQDSTIVTCSSVTIEALTGDIDAEFKVRCRTHTTTLTPGQILTFNPQTLKYTNSGASEIIIKTPTEIPVAVGESKGIGGGCGGENHEPPTIGKNLAGTKQMVENGFCIDADCFTVTKLFHEEFKLYEMMSGTHTLSTLVYCAQGVGHCNYSAIGIMPYDKDMNDAVWKIEMKGNHLGEWTPVIFDPEGFLGEVTITTQIVNDKFLSVSYTIEFKNKQTPPMKVGIQLRDDKHGVRNFYFNEGVQFNDSDAYPYVETAFETSIKVEKLCINPQSHDRDSCGFELVRDWTQKKAQDLLNDMQNGNYIYDKYVRDRYYD